MTDVNTVAQTLPAVTGAEIKALIRSWKARTLAIQAACVENEGFAALDYIIDMFADTTLEELDDETLALIVRTATADNLKMLGYTGARSNAGRSITTIHTSLLHQVKKEFGDDAVSNGGNWDTSFRGIRNTTAIRTFYTEETQRIIRRLKQVAA